MRYSLLLCLVITGTFMFQPKSAHAIIFLPAIILIPIAKIIAVVIGAVSLPSFGAGALWHKLFGSSWSKVLLIVIGFLLLAAIGLGIIIHVQNPDRPLI